MATSGGRTKLPLSSFFIPGMGHIIGGRRLKGSMYLVLGLATLGIGWCANRYGFLPLVWTMRGMNLPRIIESEMYQAKQLTAYTFGGIYLVIGLVSALDYVLFATPKHHTNTEA